MSTALYRKRWLVSALISIIAASHLGSVTAANLTREADVAAAITARVAPGDAAVWLTAGAVRFLAIERRSDNDTTHGSIALLPGRNQNPVSPSPTGALRRRLANRGWDTLTLQMPLLSPAAPSTDWLALDGEASPRIGAGVNHLRQQPPKFVALLGYDSGANQALAYAGSVDGKSIAALILLSPVPDVATAPESPPAPVAGLERLAANGTPVLLISAGRDGAAERAYAERLANQMRDTGVKALTVREIPAAAHDYLGHEALLGATVGAWLHRATQ